MQTIAEQPTQANQAYIEILLAIGDRDGRRISRRRIAESAGVNIWTVTRVIQNFRGVAPETRMAVLAAIARLTGRPVEELVLGRLAA